MATPTTAKLRVPPQEAKEKIKEQIKNGSLIFGFFGPGHGLPHELLIPGQRTFEEAESEREKWAKFTVHLLETLFTDDSIAREFGDWWLHYTDYDDNVDQLEAWMKSKIVRLESIVERLQFFPLAGKPVPVKVASAPSKQKSKDIFIVHGHDEAAKPQNFPSESRRPAPHMKVFISWSGDLSHRIALSLREWLPAVLHFVEAWVSSEDIPKGTRWGEQLASELQSTFSGIICLVPDNLTEPWLHFEAGALSKSVTTARIHPFLVGVDPNQLSAPLAQFNATRYSKDDMRKLIHALNREAADAALPIAKVDNAFDVCWPGLEKKLEPLLNDSVKNLMGDTLPSGATKENRPILSATIRLKPPDCHKTTLVTSNPMPVLAQRGECYYLRIWVQNKGGQRAEKVQVFVSRVQRQHADGLFKDVDSFLPMNLRWSHISPPQTFAEVISPGMGMHCDFGHIVDPVFRAQLMQPTPPQFTKGRTILELDLEVQPNTLSHLILEGHYRFFVQVAAANAHPTEKCWDLNLTGKWFQEEDKMFSEGIKIVPLVVR
jgi:hypothetical protein